MESDDRGAHPRGRAACPVRARGPLQRRRHRRHGSDRHRAAQRLPRARSAVLRGGGGAWWRSASPSSSPRGSARPSASTTSTPLSCPRVDPMTQAPDHADMTTSEDPANLVQRILRWLRAGYPDGVPQQDYVALLGILRRTLTPSELATRRGRPRRRGRRRSADHDRAAGTATDHRHRQGTHRRGRRRAGLRPARGRRLATRLTPERHFKPAGHQRRDTRRVS